MAAALPTALIVVEAGEPGSRFAPLRPASSLKPEARGKSRADQIEIRLVCRIHRRAPSGLHDSKVRKMLRKVTQHKWKVSPKFSRATRYTPPIRHFYKEAYPEPIETPMNPADRVFEKRTTSYGG